MESVDFLVAGCGPAGAAGLRPGFCETFDLPREIVAARYASLVAGRLAPRLRHRVRLFLYRQALRFVVRAAGV